MRALASFSAGEPQAEISSERTVGALGLNPPLGPISASRGRAPGVPSAVFWHSPSMESCEGDKDHIF